MAATCTEKSDLPSSHFFRPIVRPLNEGIPFPTTFIQRYGDGLKKIAVLKVPTGAEWRVELRRVNGQTWLGKGLQEFGEFYSIKLFYLLVFRYEGKSRFNVIICDKTASEINYPVRVKREELSNEMYDDGDNNFVIEKIENRGRKKKREIEEDGKKPNQGLLYSVVNGRRLRQRVNINGCCSVTSKAQIADDQVALKSKHPSFDFVVRRYNVFPPGFLDFPLAFSRNNFGENCEDGEFKICVPKTGKTWAVQLRIWGTRARISGLSWRRFVTENGLRVGESCTFELIKAKKLLNFYRGRN